MPRYKIHLLEPGQKDSTYWLPQTSSFKQIISHYFNLIKKVHKDQPHMAVKGRWVFIASPKTGLTWVIQVVV